MTQPSTQSATDSADFVTLDDLATRLKISKRTLEELAKTDQFPLRRLTPRGTAFVFWSEVVAWLKKRKL